MAETQTAKLGNQVKLLKSGSLTGALGGLGLGIALMGVGLALGVDWSSINLNTGMCVAGGFIVVGALMGLPGAIRNRKAQMAIHEQGFAFTDGKTQFSIRWDEITAVWKQYVRASRGRMILARVTVQGRDGAHLAFSPGTLNQGFAVTEYIQHKALEFQLPAYLKAYEQGQPLDFGPILLSKSGLALGDKSLMWDEVKSVTNHGWAIGVNESGLSAWGSADINAVPNPTLLLRLIQKVGGPAIKLTLPEMPKL